MPPFYKIHMYKSSNNPPNAPPSLHNFCTLHVRQHNRLDPLSTQHWQSCKRQHCQHEHLTAYHDTAKLHPNHEHTKPPKPKPEWYHAIRQWISDVQHQTQLRYAWANTMSHCYLAIWLSTCRRARCHLAWNCASTKNQCAMQSAVLKNITAKSIHNANVACLGLTSNNLNQLATDARNCFVTSTKTDSLSRRLRNLTAHSQTHQTKRSDSLDEHSSALLPLTLWPSKCACQWDPDSTETSGLYKLLLGQMTLSGFHIGLIHVRCIHFRCENVRTASP